MVISPVDVASVVVGIIAAGSAYASQRAANKASVTNTNVSSRLDSEKEAYERAREFDLETIDRQNGEIRDLREENTAQREKIEDLENKVETLERKINTISKRFPEVLEGMLRERLEEPDNHD